MERVFEACKDMVTVRELQQMLRIGRSKAYELIRDERIDCIRIGDKILIPKQKVIDFVENGMKQAG